MILLSLPDGMHRLRDDKVMATVVAVNIVDFEFNHASPDDPFLTNATNEIHRAACRLFDD